jgi:hypothetical protein
METTSQPATTETTMSINGEREIDTLYDSDTNEELTADEIGISSERYDEVVAASVAAEQAEGHVVIGEIGRRVYAGY